MEKESKNFRIFPSNRDGWTGWLIRILPQGRQIPPFFPSYGSRRTTRFPKRIHHRQHCP